MYVMSKTVRDHNFRDRVETSWSIGTWDEANQRYDWQFEVVNLTIAANLVNHLNGGERFSWWAEVKVL